MAETTFQMTTLVKILKTNGAPRIATKSVPVFDKILAKYAEKIALESLEIMKHSKRAILRPEDLTYVASRQ